MIYNPAMDRTLVILPTTAAVEAHLRTAVAGRGVLFGTPALTLSRLAEEIFQTGLPERRIVSAGGKRLILEETVRRRYSSGTGHFGHLQEFPGFIAALDSFCSEMKQALLSPRDFLATVRRLPDNERLLELASLYESYDAELLRQGLMDRLDLERAAVDHLRGNGPLPSLFAGIDAVATAGIHDLPPLRLALLAELARRLPVTLSLPYDPRMEQLFAAVGLTAESIEAIDNSDLNLTPEFVEPAGSFLSPLLATIRAGAPWQPPPGKLELLSAPGSYRECEEIGRRIRVLLEEGIDPGRIAVLFRSLETHGPLMEDVCRRFQIPVSYRRGPHLAASALVDACLAPFSLLACRIEREELVAFCASSYLDLRGADAEEIEAVLIEAAYIDEGLAPAEERIDRLRNRLRRQGRDTSREDRVLRALSPLLNEVRGFRGEKTLREFILLLERFIARHGIFRKGIEAADRRALKRDASAIGLFQELLRSLEGDLGALGMDERRFSAPDVRRLLHDGMTDTFLAGERQAGVAIMTFHDARELSFSRLFIGGLNEGIVPRRHTPHPLLGDRDKARIQRLRGSRLFRSAAERGLDEQLLFYLAVGCAEDDLTLSFSSADSRGNRMLLSPFLEELLAAVPLPETRIPGTRIVPDPEDCLERDELLCSFSDRRWFNSGPDAGEELASVLAEIESAAAMEETRQEFFACTGDAASDFATPHTGYLQRDDIRGSLREDFGTPPGNTFSPTALEEFGRCPFRFFIRRVLRVSPWEKPLPELEARDSGSLVHEILRRFYEERKAGGLLPLRGDEDEQSALRSTAGEVFRRWETERHTGPPLLWESEKERIVRLLCAFVALEGKEPAGPAPALFEHPFDPLTVKAADDSSLQLTGTIDRVDHDPENGLVRVVDYKLGGDASRFRDMLDPAAMGITSFQMPVYLLAAVRDLEAAGKCCSGFAGRYWLLRRLEKQERILSGDAPAGFFARDDEGRAAGSDNFLNRVCERVAEMKEGLFPPKPGDCDYCPFPSVCRHGR